MKELLKSVHICQSYRKNKSGTFFMAHGVIIIIIIMQEMQISKSDMSFTKKWNLLKDWKMISK